MLRPFNPRRQQETACCQQLMCCPLHPAAGRQCQQGRQAGGGQRSPGAENEWRLKPCHSISDGHEPNIGDCHKQWPHMYKADVCNMLMKGAKPAATYHIQSLSCRVPRMCRTSPTWASGAKLPPCRRTWACPPLVAWPTRWVRSVGVQPFHQSFRLCTTGHAVKSACSHRKKRTSSSNTHAKGADVAGIV